MKSFVYQNPVFLLIKKIGQISVFKKLT